MQQLIVIEGATASGKTALGVALTNQKNWEDRRSAIDKINDNESSDLWDTLDKKYYSSQLTLYKLTVEYLKNNAVLIEE